jgi:hypothetical protein
VSADLAPQAASEEAVQGDPIEESLADHYSEQVDYLHSKLVFSLAFARLDHKTVGSFIGLAQFEQACDVGVEDVLHAEVHPLSQHPACVVHLFPAQPDLELLPQIHGLESVVAGHEHVLPVDVQPLAARLPGDPHLLHMDAHPGHFLLEAKVFDDVSWVIARLHRQQNQRLF